jgi:hypothetical protein
MPISDAAEPAKAGDAGAPAEEILSASYLDIAEALYRALQEDDPDAYMHPFARDERTMIDGSFDLAYVAKRLQRNLRITNRP